MLHSLLTSSGEVPSYITTQFSDEASKIISTVNIVRTHDCSKCNANWSRMQTAPLCSRQQECSGPKLTIFFWLLEIVGSKGRAIGEKKEQTKTFLFKKSFAIRIG
ncbi:hypothetical protein GDO78_010866 [Eleutherodactylus coqui]|uniref:Uncharacterized protein n=1 Tax=Eleutherodactylus coqui TaxID=57060 RepID=A0A8J6F705_ELECQ|nr:hypothetical protein GDO78_010866 [Eleutherodactylus coqui]